MEKLLDNVVYLISTALVIPNEITPAHYTGETLWHTTTILTSILIVSAIVISVIKNGLNNKTMPLLVVWMIIITPTLGLTESTMLPVDRYTYLGSFFLLCAIGVQLHIPTCRNLLKGCLVIYIITMAYHNQIAHRKWENNNSLFERILKTKIVETKVEYRSKVYKHKVLNLSCKGKFKEAWDYIENIKDPELEESTRRDLKKVLALRLICDLDDGKTSSEDFINVLIKDGILTMKKK